MKVLEFFDHFILQTWKYFPLQQLFFCLVLGVCLFPDNIIILAFTFVREDHIICAMIFSFSLLLNIL